MKPEEIKDYEIGNHCFGPILRVNGEDYEDLDKQSVMDFILYMLQEDINSESLKMEVFEKALDYLQFDVDEHHYDSCDQCGNPNDYYKFVRPKD